MAQRPAQSSTTGNEQELDADEKERPKKKHRTVFWYFQDSEIEHITITTNLDSLLNLKSKKSDGKVEAVLSYTADDGAEKFYDVLLEPRGKTRRRLCDFPPLKVTFSKEQLDGRDLTEKHRKLKLVTHCNGSPLDQQNVIKEYLAYKAYNLITPNSFRVKLLTIKYRDSKDDAEIEQYGFLIENEDEIAKRLDAKEVELWGLDHNGFPQEAYQTFAMFQYMIGNTDWKTEFIHNILLVRLKDDTTQVLPIPYDFDYSGLVGSYYAIPNPNLIQTSIYQRMLFAKFDNESQAKQTAQLFLNHKETILELYANNELLSKKSKKKAIRYLDEFFKSLTDVPKLVEESNKQHYRNGSG